MENLTIKNSIIEKHPLFKKFGTTLDSISKRDYKGKYPFPEVIKALDMDEYEKIEGNADKDSTMDAVIGIDNKGDKLLLVELKLDANPMNINKKKCLKKMYHTREILTKQEKGCTTIYPTYIFVFDERWKQQARRVFNQKFPKHEYIIRTHKDFNNETISMEKI